MGPGDFTSAGIIKNQEMKEKMDFTYESLKEATSADG